MRAHIAHPFFTAHPERVRNYLIGVGHLADPKLALASLVPFVAGAAIAFDQRGSIDAALAATAYLAIFLIEIGKNAVNDLYDGHPHRLSERDLINIAWIAFAAAAVVGTFVVSESIPALLLLAVFAAAIAAAYSIPPLSLSKRGLGELAVGLIYGPGILIGTLLLLRGTITAEAIVVAAILGLLMMTAVLVDEIAAEHADAFSGRRNWAVRLGADRAASLVSLLYIVAFAVPLVWGVYAGPFRLSVVLAGVPCAMLASSAINTRATADRGAAEVWAVAAYALTGVVLSAAIALI